MLQKNIAPSILLENIKKRKLNMYKTSTIKDKIKLFLIIAFPILVTQISLYLMTFFDTVMSGQYGAADLAGTAIGSSIWVPVSTGINGIVLALTPIIAQINGSDDKREVPVIIQQGISLAIAASVVLIVIGGILLEPGLGVMRLEQEVSHVAKYYLIALGFGIVPLFIFNSIRSFMDGLGQTRASMFIIIISLPLNIFFNYIFIFGKLGLPAFGGIGAGIATSITYWIVCFISIAVLAKVHPFNKFRIFDSWSSLIPAWKYWKNQLVIGMPIAAAIFFETSIFSAVTLLMSTYSTYTIAAHQAAMNFAGLLYMIPLSIGMALTITIGFEAGGKRYKDSRQYWIIGLYFSLIVAVLAGIILYIFNGPIAGLYSKDPEVIELTKQFIIFAIFYQLADAIGAPIQGALRGYKDVNMTFIIALVSYWVVGLPVGWALATFTTLEPFGYWVGIIVGLSFGAIALFWRLIHLQKIYR